MDPAKRTAASSPRRARVNSDNTHLTGELPIVGYTGRHRVKPTTRPQDRAARLVGRAR
jgi:hypothetical protein